MELKTPLYDMHVKYRERLCRLQATSFRFSTKRE